MRRFSLNGLALLATLGAGACAGPMANHTAEADAQPVEDQAAVELRDHHRHQHRGGVTQFVAMSLDTLGPEDAARPQVEQLQRDLYACMAPTGELNRQLHLAVASGVAAGAIDALRVDAILGQLDASAMGVQACGVAALVQLHAILSPAERLELVEKVQAHWEVWRQVNDAPGGRTRGSQLASLALEVNLTPDQLDRIEAALHLALGSHPATLDRAAADANVQRFADAFAAKDFDSNSVAASAQARLAAHGANRMAVFYETVAPLLTPEQRSTLAEHLREHAGHHPTVSTN